MLTSRIKSLTNKHALRLGVLGGFLAFIISTQTAQAAGSGSETVHFGSTFLIFAVILIAGKLGNFVERFGQPAVIGELVAGIFLSALGYFGWSLIGEANANTAISFIASLGALLLLFSIGLESNIQEMKKVGINAIGVALIGVSVPFVVGTYVLAPLFFPDASSNTHLFIGASMVATSVGITSAVFRSLGISRTRAAQTVLGAAIIDDVLGLIVLAIVSALATGGSVTTLGVIGIALKSFGFLLGAIVAGSLLAPYISKAFRLIHSGVGMKIAIAIGFALVFGYLAEIAGLEPIIGAFAAGLLLDSVHFKDFDDPAMVNDIKQHSFTDSDDRKAILKTINHHRETHVEDLVSTLGHIFIPVFFVYTGMQINFGSLLKPELYVTAVIIAVIASLGKLISGVAAKGSVREKLLVGTSMIPRGEVGLVFAATGKAVGVLNDEIFSTIVLVVIMTTFIAPMLITKFAEEKTTGGFSSGKLGLLNSYLSPAKCFVKRRIS